MMKTILMSAVLATLAAQSQSPVAKGAKPNLVGDVGAGEGPAWSPDGELYFTGKGNIYKRDKSGKVEIFRKAPDGANGILFDPQGRLVACEPGNRRVTRTDKGGKITVLADRYEGKRFNQPNDLTIDGKGRIYFSDPRYGKRDGMEMDVEGVYRIDSPGKVVRVLGKEVERANGVLVSPGDRYLYVADNNNNNKGGARKLYRFTLKPDGAVDPASRKLIFDWKQGRGPDGVKMDRKGRLFVAGGLNEARPPYETNEFKGGVYIIDPESGKLIDFVPVPRDEVTNCAFGGPDLKTLFITAGGTLWRIPVETAGRVPFQRE